MKKVTKNTVIGSSGEDRVGAVVQEKLGYLWRPSTRYDVGYDGEIEVRNEETGEVTGLIIKTQSKRLQDFQSETSTSFVYTCEVKDFDYWMQSNVPDIIVISKTGTDEIYWSPIKGYFAEHPEQKADRKIIFSKSENVLDERARVVLSSLAIPKSSGIYLPPLPIAEKIYSNLLSVEYVPKKIYIAQTPFRQPQTLYAALQEKHIFTNSWVLTNKTIMSFEDLTKTEWTEIVEQGTVEEFNSSEWLDTDDPDKQKNLVNLLNRNLTEVCQNLGIKFNPKGYYYYFQPLTVQTERIIKYKSQKLTTQRQVIKAVLTKEVPKKILCYKHLGFSAKFVRYHNKWYLQLTPTYHFTIDGTRYSPLNERMLKGLKRFQKNPSVRGEIICIAEILTHGERLQEYDDNSFISFGELMTADIEGSIDEKAWSGKVDDEEDKLIAQYSDDYEEGDDEILEQVDTEGHNTI